MILIGDNPNTQALVCKVVVGPSYYMPFWRSKCWNVSIFEESNVVGPTWRNVNSGRCVVYTKVRRDERQCPFSAKRDRQAQG